VLYLVNSHEAYELVLFHSAVLMCCRCRSRRLRMCWTKAWCCSDSCRRRTCLRDITNSILPRGSCLTRASRMTRKRIWSPN